MNSRVCDGVFVFFCNLCFDVTWMFTSAFRFVSSWKSVNVWHIRMSRKFASGCFRCYVTEQTGGFGQLLAPLEVYIFFIRTALRDSDDMIHVMRILTSVSHF